MLGVGVLQNTLRTKELMIIFTVEFHLLVSMNLTHSIAINFRSTTLSRVVIIDGHGQCSQYCIVDGKILSNLMVSDFVKRTLYDRVLVDLFETFEAKSVTAREGKGLFVLVVVGFEADSAFKY